MTRSKGSDHPVARRLAIASMTVLTASGIGLVAAPMAFGQIVIPIGGSSQGATVTNSGSASANSGGNTAVGNASHNTATGGGTTGGLIAANVGLLSGPTNTSQGSAAVSTGPASAVGNSSDTTVGQSNTSGNQVASFLGAQQQGAGVTNAGSASANSGGNNAVGNASRNTATGNQDVSGGLLGLGVTLGGPTNNSTGTAAINSGAATAVGNNSSTEVGQASLRGGGGGVVVAGHGAVHGVGGAGVGPGPCASGRFGSFQNVNVSNRGEAEANTGNNTAVGNASTNDASAPQTVSGGLLGVGITIGGPVNNSTGTAVINTGPATAVGNSSSTEVSQVEGCPQVTTLVAGRQPVVVHAAKVVHARPGTKTLARTGLDTGDLGMIAGAALGMGILLVASQRRRFVARHAAVPMAGFGFGMGTD
ncbi:MAG TPA: hypothetical protein VHF24_01285, partial [Acidimicrobiales bacterium]|nr:hypothetical protein [Acidimicrobiales bacterium]